MGARGEVPIQVCGKPRTLAWTAEAILGIEERLRVGMPELQRRAFGGDVRIGDLAVIVHWGLKGGGYAPKDSVLSLHDIVEDVVTHFSYYCEQVGVFMGGVFESREKDAPPKTA